MCTAIRFTGADGALYFGRNLDWTCGYGERLLYVPLGYTPTWAFLDTTVERSEHPVMGIGIIGEGKPLFFDCANSAGLAVAGLNFPATACYEPAPVSGRVNVAAYELPFLITRTYSTVNEVRDALADISVIAEPVNEHYPVAHLHWLVADRERSVVLEYFDGALHIHDNPVDVLANEPRFEWHRENLRNYLLLNSEPETSALWGSARLHAFGSGAGMQGIPGDFCSPSRFVKTAYVNTHYPAQDSETQNIARLFRTLGSVAVPKGCARMEGDAFEVTLYTSGYSSLTKTYYLATYDDPAIKSSTMDDFDPMGTEIITAPLT